MKKIRFMLSVFFLCLSVSILAQTKITIRGTVLDKDNSAVIGVNVAEKGTSNGTITDAQGGFSLKVSSLSAIVQISSIGYQTAEFPASDFTGGKKIVLQESSVSLGEVVTIGYGQVRKKDATGSVVSIKAEEINKGLTMTPTDMLTGKVAGLSVITDGGEPGSSATIRIRGGSSLTASNDPLIVVDGIPMNSDGPGGLSNPLSLINPSDIESFTVLMDASATAIYGSRASNGVIIITTKKGVAGQKTRITYNGTATISKRKKSIDVLNASEYRDLIDNTFDTSSSTYAEVVAKLGSSDTDWQSEIFQTSFGTDHNLSVFGAIKNSIPYRVSVGYTNQDGILKTSNFKRYTGSFSLTPSLLNDHLNVALNGKGSYSETKRGDTGAIGAAIAFDPTQSVKNGSKFGGYFTWTTSDSLPNTVATDNPVAMLEMKNDMSYTRTFVGNTQLDYKVHGFPDLKFNLNMGIDYSDANGKVIVDPDAPMNYASGGYKKTWDTDRKNTVLDFYAQYNKTLNEDNKFDIMGGYSWQHFWYKTSETEITKFDADGLAYTDYTSVSNDESEYFLVSFFGRLNYALKNKYLLTLTLRDDGSSHFSENNRWGLFPSAAFAWKLNEESFMQGIDYLSDLKLRVGYGITGQQNINQGDYPYMSVYEQGGSQAYYLMGYDDNGDPIWVSVIRPAAYNPDLKWEETSTWNVGLDYGFFDNRITGSIDGYVRKTKDLINAETKVPAGANFAETVVSNVGNLENRGVEFSINAKPVWKKDFTWTLGYNLAFNKTKITKLNESTDASAGKSVGWVGGDGGTYSQIHSTGYAPYTFYLYEQVYDEDGKPIEGLYVDQNGDGTIDEEDLHHYKKPAADVLMGFSSKWTYKEWDFGFNGRVSLGNYVYNNVAATSASLSASAIYGNSFPSNRSKSAFDTNFEEERLLSDYYVQNASFLKLDNVTLGYTFENAFKKTLSARLYGTVQNVLCLTPYDGIDPELNGGIDSNIYPRPLTFIFGININF
jgi:TonB-dependent starch-binding outer membrane protein SusC